MPPTPRYYQQAAADAVWDYFHEEEGNPLVDMATGTGKSLTEAMVDQRVVQTYQDFRVVNTTHVVELVEGNWLELLNLWPNAPAGIAAAALDRRDLRSQILFTQLQTVYDKAARIGHVDLLKIDEVHLVPPSENTMYRRLINDLLEINPDMRIAGFSATLYRLDNGRLDEGEDRLFDRVVYNYGIRQGIDDGYLTPVTSKPVETKIDLSGVGRHMGDFKKGALAEATDKDETNRAVIEEVMDVEGHRKKALFFCAGIAHAEHMAETAREMTGRTCEVISGKTPKAERRSMLAAYKAGEIWGLFNDNVMSTGTNVPGIDLIVDTAGTMSANRYVQRVGRGTRVVWPRGFDPESTDADGRRDAISNGPKPNCRYMDFAGNINRHGPVDMVEPKRPKKGSGDAPIKQCPGCQEILHASVRLCWCCGHEFEYDDTPKLLKQASDAPILSNEPPSWQVVSRQTFRRHEAKVEGKPPTVRVDFMVGMKVVKKWICPEHSGKAKSEADRFWHIHGGKRPFPKSVDEWLERADELVATAEVEIKYGGKHPEIVGWRAGTDSVEVEAGEPEGERYRLRALAADWDDVPF